MADVINLNRFRKRKDKEHTAKRADENRVRHGKTKSEKELDVKEHARVDGQIDGHLRERGVVEEDTGCSSNDASGTPTTDDSEQPSPSSTENED